MTRKHITPICIEMDAIDRRLHALEAIAGKTSREQGLYECQVIREMSCQLRQRIESLSGGMIGGPRPAILKTIVSLQFQPMPLLKRAAPFDDSDWIYELKMDGFRALALIEHGRAQLLSRNGNPFASFSALAESISDSLPNVRAVNIKGHAVTVAVEKEVRRQSSNSTISVSKRMNSSSRPEMGVYSLVFEAKKEFPVHTFPKVLPTRWSDEKLLVPLYCLVLGFFCLFVRAGSFSAGRDVSSRCSSSGCRSEWGRQARLGGFKGALLVGFAHGRCLAWQRRWDVSGRQDIQLGRLRFSTLPRSR